MNVPCYVVELAGLIFVICIGLPLVAMLGVHFWYRQQFRKACEKSKGCFNDISESLQKFCEPERIYGYHKEDYRELSYTIAFRWEIQGGDQFDVLFDLQGHILDRRFSWMLETLKFL